ncbi:hypothetical protein ACP4OV_030434 [Aristida adscensionis]
MAAETLKNHIPAAGEEAPSSAAQEVHTQVYRRSPIRRLRVLDAKIAKLELQLNELALKEESSKGSASSGLVEDVNPDPKGPSYPGLLQEIEDVRSKRTRVYNESQKQLPQDNKDGDAHSGAGAPPLASNDADAANKKQE